MTSAGTTAQELSKLISTAVNSAAGAAGDAAEADRAVGALRALQRLAVSAALLKETEAGKRVNKLSKHAVTAVADAASAVVAAWKDCVKQQLKNSGSGGGGGGGSGVARSGSFASTGDAGAAASRDGSQDMPLAAVPTAPGSSAAPAAAAGPGSSGAPRTPAPEAAAARPAPAPPTGNPKRDKARNMMLDALALVLGEDVDPQAPLGQLAAEAEAALWAANCEGAREPSAAYLSKVRTVVFNLKDPSNPDLRGRVAAGVIAPHELASMSAEEMASDARKRQNAQIRKEMAAEAVRGQQQQATTDQFQCGKCKQRKVTYYQLQTRSADEPMTNFCTCTVCGNRWKFC